jgi:putative PEP-CTERM system histidine kinase
MRHFGESFSRSLLIALGFVAGVGLLIFLLSESVKRKIKVLLHRHFYENKYDYRQQWMEFTERLTSSRSKTELCQAALAGFCDTFGLGCACLFLKDHNRNAFVPVERMEMDPIGVRFPESDPLVSVMAGSKWIINIREQRTASSPEAETFFREYRVLFLVPLFLHDAVDGFVALGKPLSATEVYTYEDYDLMKAMAFQASSALLNLRLGDQLAQARDMEAMGKVSAFVLHDLKNLVYTLSLMLDNARLYIGNPEFQEDMIQSLGNTVTKMKILISQLKNLPGRKMLKKEAVDLRALALETASFLTEPSIPVKGESVAVSADRDELQKVVLNLVLNAMDATSGKGPVSVEVGSDGQPFIRVADGGCGISEEFIRDGLFTPFRTTKKKGLGIGLYQCKQITEAHGGWIEVASEMGRGTVFTVWLPSEESDALGTDRAGRAA